MIEIIITHPDNFEKSVKRFEKICKKDGFMTELRDRKYYKKPSEIRREKVRERERNNKKDKHGRQS